MKRNPPWKVAGTRPGAVGCRVSMPPTPASPRDSSDAGAPGEVDTAVPTGTSAVSAGPKETARAVGSNAVTAAVWVPTVMGLPTSRFAAEATVPEVAPGAPAPRKAFPAG